MVNILWEIIQFIWERILTWSIFGKKLWSISNKISLEQDIRGYGDLGKFNELTGHMYNERQYKVWNEQSHNMCSILFKISKTWPLSSRHPGQDICFSSFSIS